MVDHLFWGGAIRRLWPTESKKFRDHLMRLSDEGRRLRFGNPVADGFINDYAATMGLNGTIVFAYVRHGRVHAAAELRRLGATGSDAAEAAFSVETEFQNQGVGTEMMGYLIRSARNRGIRRLWMSCLAENTKMRAVARKHDANLEFVFGDVVGEITTESPDVFSLASEAVSDRMSFVMAVMDLGSDLQRVA